jgi:hypothetical protein
VEPEVRDKEFLMIDIEKLVEMHRKNNFVYFDLATFTNFKYLCHHLGYLPKGMLHHAYLEAAIASYDK